MTTINWYDVLLLERDCTLADIKSSYKQLAQIYHPDKKPHGDPDIFELITSAYDTLRNPKSRELYDNTYKVSKESESDHFTIKENSFGYFRAQEVEKSKKPKKIKRLISIKYLKIWIRRGVLVEKKLIWIKWKI